MERGEGVEGDRDRFGFDLFRIHLVDPLFVENEKNVDGIEVLEEERVIGMGSASVNSTHPGAPIGRGFDVAGGEMTPGEGAGNDPPSQFFEDENGFAEAQSNAPGGLGHAQGKDAELGQVPPEVGVGGPFGRESGDRLVGQSARAKSANAFGESSLIVADLEIHEPETPEGFEARYRGSLGRPRILSEMMFR